MPVAVTESSLDMLPVGPPRKRWTRTECAALDGTGLFDSEHLELIDGELINKMGKKRRHVNGLTAIQLWLAAVFGGEFVNFEAPIDVSPEDNPTNEPEPDLIVLSRPFAEFAEANPQSADLRLVVEVSDTTLGFDLTAKARLYARAGIADYWVLDVQGRRLIVHRDPQAGRYVSVAAYSEQESVAPLVVPETPFPVAAAFPSQARK